MAVCQADVINVFTRISTGMISTRNFWSQTILLIVPRPISIMIPVMPLMLSTHPTKGSLHAAVTKNKIILILLNTILNLKQNKRLISF